MDDRADNKNLRKRKHTPYDRLTHPQSQLAWRQQQDIPLRFPRAGWEQLKEVLLNIASPELRLRKYKDRDEIVICFPIQKDQLPETIRRVSKNNLTSLEKAFDECLWFVVKGETKSLGSQLRTISQKLYYRAWIHLMWVRYQDRFHPTVDKWLAGQFEKFSRDLELEAAKEGRRRTTKRDLKSLRDRYEILLAQCTRLHGEVETVIKNLKKGQEGSEVVIGALWKKIYGMRGGSNILEGNVFDEIPYGKPREKVRLHNPNLWKPAHLATALLARECWVEYETIEKKLRKARKRTAVGKRSRGTK